jgi:TPR repeat protein
VAAHFATRLRTMGGSFAKPAFGQFPTQESIWRAAENGDPNAFLAAATLSATSCTSLPQDSGLPQDLDLSLKYRKIFADTAPLDTLALAANNLFRQLHFEDVFKSFPQDDRAHLNGLAMYLLERAAERGDAGSYQILGHAHCNGIGVPSIPKNVKKAFALYRASAERDYPLGQYQLSMAYHQGQGVERDWVKGAYWLEKAVSHGSDDPFYAFVIQYKQHYTMQRRYLIEKVNGLSGVRISDDAAEAFVDGPWRDDFVAKTTYDLLALCFIHGTCGMEKNMRLAKDLLVISAAYFPEPSSKALLKQLRRCAGCGKYAYWTCKLCRGVRYCSLRCQKWHWKHGDGEPHKVTCPRVVTTLQEDDRWWRLHVAYNTNSQVEITGLVSRPDLNGQAARVEKYVIERDRYHVKTEASGEEVNVKPCNLILIKRVELVDKPTYPDDEASIHGLVRKRWYQPE